MSTWMQGHQYSKIEQEESQTSAPNKPWQTLRIHVIYISLLLFLTIFNPPLTLQTAYYAEEPVRSILRLPLSAKTLQINLSYAMPPSEAVNKAWSSLIPSRGGFFTYPKIAPEESCFAVFHQLHCLDTIRLALYESHPNFATRNGDHNHAHDVYHIGHCFDLLRQTIMCKPDLTIEIANKTLGGVTGFGTEHQCINWQQLMDWMRLNE
ncbi:hypothetical protein CPLU01_09977 [Colletotrichum plurivorum]|uniref:Tat pathway signal sequence n=1 Tax=Colletotrichum plurivorum TaxID=2175906 RepID=A0A8H6NA05_9PEZI|nr:hypothetical protein CPLU01_09977 [Colletotrichum plurivorum]